MSRAECVRSPASGLLTSRRRKRSVSLKWMECGSWRRGRLEKRRGELLSICSSLAIPVDRILIQALGSWT